MSGQFFIQLLNPGIGLLFAAAFFLLWLNRRDRYVAYAAGAYTASAIAFLILDVGPVLPFDLHRIPANIGFLATGALFAAAIIGRYGLPIPWRSMAVTGAASMTVFLWFLLGQPSIGGRILSISIGAAIIAMMIVRALWPIDKVYLIDRVLFWVAALSVVNLTARPIILLALGGGFDSYVGFQQSVYWTTVQFSQAMVAILAAIGLMVAVAIDQISELRRQVDDDNLSGLLNRRGFEARAGSALRRCIDDDRPAALMIADLDHFKRVNDTYGHAVGDAIIAAFGAHVRAIGPVEMVAGRIGGEEFALLVPGAGIEAARQLAEAVRTGLAAACANRIPVALAPTVSLGIAVGVPGAGLSALMQEADQALYEAKRSGRNRVRTFTPNPVRLAASCG
ncbi:MULTISPECIES: GGDEF domain-containing protein [unclassified Sphingopyxis]|uniref:GGDEF domain-containing protein n=1 Tax=unclassified Sphingopyxis TaxID=2614943 RepID=UPI00285E71D9|nr:MULTISPECIES: GGDEF domain-containing protein [unclassified Sphingopyxis]MDR6834145.1 diguanylate cyclase (GGDEF)-like protein [Sphingopyxis sp. BE122]MDR7226413.1 diguanylate cyclase (GGDEF)-like protein [Sphingopyxis sp. BE259]